MNFHTYDESPHDLQEFSWSSLSLTLIYRLFQINTNGFVSSFNPPAESEHLGKMPANFTMMAALLGDLDNSDGQGNVFYRRDSSPDVLSRAHEHIKQAFPRDYNVEPSSVLVITWVNMAARGTPGQGDGLDAKVSRVADRQLKAFTAQTPSNLQ